ncbi:MAG: UDP-2,3-diacylglucosamine diphosphatase [Pirellula sp.]|nr:UDP-2,3-diacylglucosamine diphosphatase [Pirellula sp.]
MPYQRRVRSLFISDIHLGCRFAQTENFMQFLEQIRPDRLYVLGDFFDGWKLSAGWYWPQLYTRLMNRLFDLSRAGTQIYYTPGNHDAFLRNGEVLKMIQNSGVKLRIEDEFVFEAQDGRRYLLLHGDKFDVVETKCQWLSVAVTFAYEALLSANWWYRRARPTPGRSPYSFCAKLKNFVKTGVRFMSHFEQNLFSYARKQGCTGVICGHIHTPGIFGSDEMRYLNTGDWVENCTALTEQYDGTMHLESFFPSHPSQAVPMGTLPPVEDYGVVEAASDIYSEPETYEPSANT